MPRFLKFRLPNLACRQIILAFFLFICATPSIHAQTTTPLNVSITTTPSSPNPIFPGDATSLRIVLTNSDFTPLTNVAMTDVMPVGLVILATPAPTYACSDFNGSVATTGSVSINGTFDTITLTGGTLPAAISGHGQGVCNIDVPVTSYSNAITGDTVLTDTIPLANVTADTVAGANADGVQTVTVHGFKLPIISKSFASSPIVRSDQTDKLTITIDNSANASVNLPLNSPGSISIQDSFPAGLQTATTLNATSTCTGGGTPMTFAPTAGAASISATGGVVAAGGSCSISVNVVGTDTGGAYSKSFNNSISRMTDFFNARHQVPAADATDSVTVQSALQVTEAFALGTIAAGQTSSLVVTLKNASAASSLTLGNFSDTNIDNIGNGLYGLKVTGSPSTSCTGASVAANGGATGVNFTATGATTLGPLASCTITIPFIATLQTAGTPQTFTNPIAAGAVAVASDNSIISQAATASVNVVDQLTIDKDVNITSVGPGNPLQFSLKVHNFSNGALTAVTVTDNLPNGLTLLTNSPYAPSGDANCTGFAASGGGTSTAVFTVASVPANSGAGSSICTITFYSMPPPGVAIGTIIGNTIASNGASGTAGGITVRNFNGANSANVTVGNIATVNEVFAPSSLPEGNISKLTITFTNISAQALTSASFTNTLPTLGVGQSVVIASPANASTTCANATIDATPGNATWGISGATIPARAASGGVPGAGAAGTCTLTVNVIGAAGAYDNAIPAGALSGIQTYADGTLSSSMALSPGTVHASLTYSSALNASKSFSPTAVESGGKSTVTVVLSNIASSGTLNNVTVHDTLPSGMVVATPSNAYTTCGGSPQVTTSASAPNANLSGVVIPSSSQCAFLFDVIATTPGGGGNWVNTLNPGDVTAAGGVRNVVAAPATLTNISGGGVSVTNSTNPASLSAPGQTSILTILLSNTGTVALSNTALTNYFTSDGTATGTATGMVIAGTPNAQTTCAGGIVKATAGGNNVALTKASIPVSPASCTITVNVVLTTTGTVVDTIPALAITDDQGIQNTVLTSTSLSAGPDLGLTKLFVPAVVAPGTRSRLQITVINPGSTAATNLAMTDTMPAGLTIPAGANPSTTCTGATMTNTSSAVSISGGSLGANANCVTQIDVTAAAAGTYTNSMAAGAVTAVVGTSSTSNPASASTNLLVGNAATIAKSFSPASVTPSTSSTLTITLTNPNSIALTGAVLVDTLPTGLTVALTPNASTTCTGGTVAAAVSATSVTLTGATIPASGSCTIKADTVSNVAGTYVNTIPAGTLTTNEGVTNQTAVTGTVVVSDPPTVNKQFSPVSIASGGTSTLSIVLGNTNGGAATLLSALVDTLPTSPAPITVAATPAVGGTCTTGNVTAAANSGTITYASGATIPAGGCTITVNVTGSTAGTYVNTYPVGALHTTLGDNVQPANATLTISPLGYISGKVFNDNAVTPNGIYAGNDTPISGITVNLSGTSTATTTTDALGNYSFTGLAAGTYTVTMPTQPAGTNPSITKAGTIDTGTGTVGTPTATGTTPASVANIILTNTGTVATSPNNNFSVVIPSSISGTVFLDQNSNGTQDAGDTALTGVTMQLLNASNTVVATTTTDSSGNYSFTGLAAGTYTVKEPTQPTGTANGITTAGTVPNGGTPGTATTTAVVPSAITGIVLPSNTASKNNNFAEVPTGRQIAGRVYTDANNNGLVEANELGIGGVALTLSGTDLNGLAVTASTTTGSDGRYVFSGLAAGTYTVTEPAQPSGTTNGITTPGSIGGTATLVSVLPSAISAITLTGTNTVSSDNNFGEIGVPLANTGLISGSVYVDANNDGIFQASEQGIAGVTVTLTGTNDNGTPVNMVTTTTANGGYSFSNLFGSLTGYTITETQPANYFDGKTTVPVANPGTATTGKPVAVGGSDVITKVVLQNNAQLIGYNFGELQASSIAGNVYVDTNNNGVFETGEIGIGGVTVTLTGTDVNGGAVSQSTQTAPDGSYKFSQLAASNTTGYTIAETQPSAYPDGKTTIQSGNPGSAGAAKPVQSGAADVIAKVVLQPNTQLTNYNFGELPTTSVAGNVYLDANNNGSFETGETGIASVIVKLTGTDINNNPVNLATTTGSDGSYAFTKLAPSNSSGYTVTETQPSGYLDGKTTIKSGNPGTVTTAKPLSAGGSDVITKIVVAANDNLTNYNFGETPAGSVSGFVYVDANNSGVKDAGEAAIAGVAIGLTGTDGNGQAVNLSTTTAADGSYSFTGLVPSNAAGYTITEIQPANYPDGKTTSPTGTITASKPVAAGGSDIIAKVVVAAGANLPNNNFGELTAASIAGFVYLDANNSGTKDSGETGISGVTVKLTGTSANGTAVNQSVSTGGDGSFSFTGLAPSDGSGYALTEIQPAGYIDGKNGIAAGNPGSSTSGKPVSTSNIDVISGIKLVSGAALTNYLFGETETPTLKHPIVTGYVWFDSDHSRIRPIDGSQTGEPGWTVQLSQNGTLICTVQTDGTGFYQFDNLHCPDYINGLPTGSGFSISFSKNGNTLPNVPISGGNQGQVPPTGGQIVGITLNAGEAVVEQDLPLDPAGVVYDSLTRKPVNGAVVKITGPAGFDPSTQLVGSTAAQTQVVGDDGLYQFLLQNNYPTGVYTLSVTAPAGYLPAPSSILPACNGIANIGLLPNPALIQASNTAPPQSVPALTNPAACVGAVAGGAKTTQYYFNFTITHGGSAPILNNHIPLDPILTGGLIVTKTTQMENVSVGGLVPYTITVTNTQKAAVAGVDLHDQMPPGFKYRNGSATRNGLPAPPVVNGRALDWAGMTFAPSEKKTFVLLLAVGTGVGDGEYTNQAWAANGPTGGLLSNVAAATVRIVPDPTFDCPDVIGKVFDDRNANGYQDEGEPGIPGVRLSTVRGLLVTTDSEGRFHVPCPDIPNADRGSNFVMKLDDRTLPSGYRLTTENPRDIRLTAGKLSKLNFGATIHRVVRVELSDAAFEPGSTKLLPEWQKQIDDLPKELEKRPSVVRLAYAPGKDAAGLVSDRVAALRRKIRDDWEAREDRYTLMVETEESPK